VLGSAVVWIRPSGAVVVIRHLGTLA
jgi:hypothetical protein